MHTTYMNLTNSKRKHGYPLQDAPGGHYSILDVIVLETLRRHLELIFQVPNIEKWNDRI